MTSIPLNAKGARLRGRFNDVMATRRAYAACFGTGAALVACAALLFVLASAIVAFNGLPGDGGALAPVSVSGNASQGPVSSPAATRLAALAAATALSAQAARGAVAPRGAGPHRVAVAAATTSGRGSAPAARPIAGGTTPLVRPVVTGTVGPTAVRSAGSTVTRVGQTMTKVTAGTSGAIGGGAGRVVGGAGSAVGGAVAGAGQTLGGLSGN